MLSSPPPSSKVVFFSLPDFLGGVHSPLWPKALSLYLSLSSLFPSFTEHKEKERGRGRSLSPGPGGPRGGLLYKGAESERKEQIMRQ